MRYTGVNLYRLRTYALRRGFRLQRSDEGGYWDVIDLLAGGLALKGATRDRVADYLRRYHPVIPDASIRA